jgi:hypothetical protein
MADIRSPFGTADSCSEEDLRACAAHVRAECHAALARLDAIDPAILPPSLRAEYEEHRQRCLELRALSEDEAMALHEAACPVAGRELTPAEARASLERQ